MNVVTGVNKMCTSLEYMKGEREIVVDRYRRDTHGSPYDKESKLKVSAKFTQIQKDIIKSVERN